MKLELTENFAKFKRSMKNLTEEDLFRRQNENDHANFANDFLERCSSKIAKAETSNSAETIQGFAPRIRLHITVCKHGKKPDKRTVFFRQDRRFFGRKIS